MVFEAFGVEQLRGKPRMGHLIGPEAPLVGKVVDGEERGRSPPEGVVRQGRLQIDRHGRRRPVVAMDNIGLPTGTGNTVQGRLAEEAESFGIVVVFVGPVVVGAAVAPEIVVVLDQVERHIAIGQGGLPEAAVGCMPPEVGDADALARGLGQGRELGVIRQHDTHVVAGLAQGLGQGAGNIGQPARHNQRCDLGSDE